MSNSLFINGVWLQGSGTTFVKQTRLITKLYGQALKLRLVMLRKLAKLLVQHSSVGAFTFAERVAIVEKFAALLEENKSI